MLLIRFKYFGFFILLNLVGGVYSAQSCGFGCLGLSGVFGGYTYQQYNADGLNQYLNLNVFDLVDPGNEEVKFGEGRGFRVGGNIFRAKFDDYFFSAKGFFQFLKEKKNRYSIANSALKNEFELEMNYWGLCVDFGVPVFSHLDFKLFEGGITFYNTHFKILTSENGIETAEKKFENEKSDFGYYFGTGFVLHLIPDYISIEGTASYYITSIEKLAGDKIFFPILDNKKMIEAGGFGATVQLNIGVPL